MNCKAAMGVRFAIGLICLLMSVDVSGQFAGGTGTKNDPFLIQNHIHLNNVREYLNTPDIYFSQIADVDLQNVGNWIPIGGCDANPANSSAKFSGHFDGNGYRIFNLLIDYPIMNNVGLFGHIGPTGENSGNPVTLKNIRLVNACVKGARGVGGLVGRVTGNANTLIEGCSVTGGSITGNAATGGLVGSNNSYLQTPGGTDNPVIFRCFSTADVYFSGNGTDNVKFGGLVGCNQKGNIADSFSQGKVVVYQNQNKIVERIGGLAGCVEYLGKIIHSYSTGLVIVNEKAAKYGGLVGNVSGLDSTCNGWVINSYWNIKTSGQMKSAGGIGLTAAAMKNKHSFADWDFGSTWRINQDKNNGYPYIEIESERFPTYYSDEIEPISGWRMISSPVGTTFSDLLGGFITQGFENSGYPDIHSNLYWFDESDPNPPGMGWKSPAQLNDRVEPGKGYFFYMYGNQPTDKRYFLDLPERISVTGKDFFNGQYFEFNQYTTPLTYTSRVVKYFSDNYDDGYYDISIMEAGWNLLGNPTAHILDWDSEGWQKRNIDNTIYIWDPADNEYKYWNGKIGNLEDGLIQPFQGFWVKANQERPFLSFDKNAVKNESPVINHKIAESQTVRFDLTSEGGLKSTAFISFDRLASSGIDPEDAFRLEPLSNDWLSVYTTSGLNCKLPLVINNLPFPEDVQTEYPLYIKGRSKGKPVTGLIIMRWTIDNSWPAGYGLVLYDHINRKAISMHHNTQYQFQMPNDNSLDIKILHSNNPDNDLKKSPVESEILLKSTKSNNPFSVVITKGNVDPYPKYIMKKNEFLGNYPNPVKTSTTFRFSIAETSKVLIELYNLQGILEDKIIERQFAEGVYSVTWHNPGLKPGMYLLKFSNQQFSSSDKILITN